MDITERVLEKDVIEKGYTAEESIRDSRVTLCHKGMPIKEFYGCKAKVINGAARMHSYGMAAYIADCKQSMESVGISP